jgi:hypothetical protein
MYGNKEIKWFFELDCVAQTLGVVQIVKRSGTLIFYTLLVQSIHKNPKKCTEF